MSKTHIITVDWGTSNLRAHLCKVMPNGQLEYLSSKQGAGVSKVISGFETELMTLLEPWSDECPQIPVLLSGLIGSSIGWKEVPYISAPTSPKRLAAGCFHFNCQGHPIYIVPGVSCYLGSGTPEVMRGEELQVLGWLQLCDSHKQGQHLLCLPGTHTKWVLVKDGAIQCFKTAMTGELFDLLSQHSVLIQEQDSGFSHEVFIAGAEHSLNTQQDSLIHSLFSTRSKQLFNEISAQDAASWLSGLLIGSDVQLACNAQEWQINNFSNIAIIGSQQLADCFEKVLELNDIQAKTFDVTATSIAGFSAIYNGLLSTNVIDR